jgi:hypothetical protein
VGEGDCAASPKALRGPGWIGARAASVTSGRIEKCLRFVVAHRPSEQAGSRPKGLWPGRCAVRLGLWIVLACAAAGCAGAPAVEDYKPYRERAGSQVEAGLRVSVAVPTPAEARAIYGVDLAGKAMQPVWIEVQNDTATPYWFLPSGLDPQYFSASEAVHAFHSGDASDAEHAALDERFYGLRFRNPIMPGATASGFVLTNLDEGNKAVDVDLVSEADARSFTFLTTTRPSGPITGGSISRGCTARTS